MAGKSGKAPRDTPRLCVAIACDQESNPLKERLALALREDRYTVRDLGGKAHATGDFIDAAELASQSLNGDADLAIVVSTSGAGAALAASKLVGIRAVHCADAYTARQSRRQFDANVLCLGTNVMGIELAVDIARAWARATFSTEQRHQRLVDRLNRLEDGVEDGGEAAPGKA